MGLALMSEKAGGRREAGVLAGLHLAAVGLQVRVDELATGWVARVSYGDNKETSRW